MNRTPIIKRKLRETLDVIKDEQHMIIIGGTDDEETVCIMIGDPEYVIGTLTSKLILAISSIADPVMRMRVKQTISTRIMTMDIDFKKILELYGEDAQNPDIDE